RRAVLAGATWIAARAAAIDVGLRAVLGVVRARQRSHAMARGTPRERDRAELGPGAPAGAAAQAELGQAVVARPTVLPHNAGLPQTAAVEVSLRPIGLAVGTRVRRADAGDTDREAGRAVCARVAAADAAVAYPRCTVGTRRAALSG